MVSIASEDVKLMILVDLIGLPENEESRLVTHRQYQMIAKVPNGDPLPDGWVHIKQNISLDEARELMNTQYGSSSRAKC